MTTSMTLAAIVFAVLCAAWAVYLAVSNLRMTRALRSRGTILTLGNLSPGEIITVGSKPIMPFTSHTGGHAMSETEELVPAIVGREPTDSELLDFQQHWNLGLWSTTPRQQGAVGQWCASALEPDGGELVACPGNLPTLRDAIKGAMRAVGVWIPAETDDPEPAEDESDDSGDPGEDHDLDR